MDMSAGTLFGRWSQKQKSVDNEIIKEELLIKDTAISLLLLCIEWGSVLLGALWGMVPQNCPPRGKRNCMFIQTLPSVIPLIEGCPSSMLHPLYHYVTPEWSSNLSATCTEVRSWQHAVNCLWQLLWNPEDQGDTLYSESLVSAVEKQGDNGVFVYCWLHDTTSDYLQSTVSSSIKWW